MRGERLCSLRSMIIDGRHDLLSLGRLAELLQTSPAQIERAAEAAGVEVPLRLDGRIFFRDADVGRLREALKPEPVA